MIDLSKDLYVTKPVSDENLKGVTAKFKRLNRKDYIVVHNADLGSILTGDNEEALKVIQASVTDIEGVEVKKGKKASFEDILAKGGIALISAFTTALIVAQYDKDFLSK